MLHLGLTETHFRDWTCFRTIDGDLNLPGPLEIQGAMYKKLINFTTNHQS